MTNCPTHRFVITQKDVQLQAPPPVSDKDRYRGHRHQGELTQKLIVAHARLPRRVLLGIELCLGCHVCHLRSNFEESRRNGVAIVYDRYICGQTSRQRHTQNRPGRRTKYCGQFVCVSVCPRAYLWNCWTDEIFLHIPRGRGSVLLWRRCDSLCTSGFMDDVTFGRSSPYGDALRYRGGVWCLWSLFVVSDSVQFHAFVLDKQNAKCSNNRIT